jgi:hypothetical protein
MDLELRQSLILLFVHLHLFFWIVHTLATFLLLSCAAACCEYPRCKIPSPDVYTSLLSLLSFCEASMHAFRRDDNTYKRCRLHHDDEGRRMERSLQRVRSDVNLERENGEQEAKMVDSLD